MKKVIVTGGAGFIGSHLVEGLIDRGYEVHVIDNLVSGTKENIPIDAIFHDCDVTDLEAIRPIFKDAHFVFHLAALPQVQYSIENPRETHEVNVKGTLNVLLASFDNKIKKVIYSASSAVYGDHDALPYKEELVAIPKSPYGLEKYIGENYCSMWSRVYKLPTVSLRYFNVFGPRQSPEGAYASVMAKFTAKKLKGEPLPIVGEGTQTRDFVYVKDVVNANIMAAENESIGNGEVINIGSGKSYSVLEIADLFGGPKEFIAPRLEPNKSQADISKAKNLLGWEPQVDLQTGITSIKAFYQI
jgi:UDP-glucose 4-epimerase